MFLPINKKEMLERGWEQPDFILISGDAYIDHPSFGVAIISRILELHGYKVCILPQPNINDKEAFREFGHPRLGFLITSGNIDSMVNHYSVSKRLRKKDYYTDNGEFGKRPDRAVIKYSQVVRQLFSESTIILGGIEASLRKLAHYDYWDDKVRRSVLLDAKADMIVYGMGEKPIVELADYLDSGLNIKDITFIKGTCFKSNDLSMLETYIELPSYDEVLENKDKYNESFKHQFNNKNYLTSKPLVEKYRNTYVIVNEVQDILTQQEMDQVYDLPYERTFHPSYNYIPAIEEVKHSIIINRGCFGSCSFCALTFHQGRIIQSRSKDSILKEAKIITNMSDFKGYINDVGGPTANFYHQSCSKQNDKSVCTHKECLHPQKCSKLDTSHKDYLDILREIRSLENVKKVFVRSGIRYDYLMYDNSEFFDELVKHHISGQLKVAPEHISSNVLGLMGKPNKELYLKFVDKYYRLNEKYNKNQFLVPYLMSSHPGSTLNDAIELALYIKSIGYIPEQVQDFYPTPSTLSTTMYYTEKHPLTNKSVFVAKNKKDKAMQRALIQYKNPKNRDLVREALIKANRKDLIGPKPQCLIK